MLSDAAAETRGDTVFVQIIEGRAKDPDGIKRMVAKWQQELRPGATGYLGSTSGVTADGRAISIVRFDSPESARANSQRAEQTAFFEEMKQLYDGEPIFAESTDVEEFLGGGSDNAGFVQVMKNNRVDRAAMKEIDAQFEKFESERPDLLGEFRVWTGPNSFVGVAYFTSEAEARVGEAKELPGELQKLMTKFNDMMRQAEFLDLTDPVIT